MEPSTSSKVHCTNWIKLVAAKTWHRLKFHSWMEIITILDEVTMKSKQNTLKCLNHPCFLNLEASSPRCCPLISHSNDATCNVPLPDATPHGIPPSGIPRRDRETLQRFTMNTSSNKVHVIFKKTANRINMMKSEGESIIDPFKRII